MLNYVIYMWAVVCALRAIIAPLPIAYCTSLVRNFLLRLRCIETWFDCSYNLWIGTWRTHLNMHYLAVIYDIPTRIYQYIKIYMWNISMRQSLSLELLYLCIHKTVGECMQISFYQHNETNSAKLDKNRLRQCFNWF